MKSDDGRRSQHAGAGEDRAVGVGRPSGDAADVVGQRDREGLQVGFLGDEERPEELVPRSDEREEHSGEHRRPDERQRDRPQDAQLAGSVDAGRGEEVLGELQEELPEDEDRGGVDGEGRDHAEVGVGQPVAAHDHHVERDHQQLEGDDLHQQHRREQRSAASEVQAGQRVARQQAEHDGAQDDGTGEDAGVDQRAPQVHPAVDVPVVVQREAAGRERAGHRRVRLELQRGDEHVVEGEQEEHGPQGEQEHARPADLLALLLRCARRRVGRILDDVCVGGGQCHLSPSPGCAC